MSTPLPLSIKTGKLPYNYSAATAKDYFHDILARMEGHIKDTILGSTAGTAPTTNVGPWLKSANQWRVWIDRYAQYLPDRKLIKAGDSDYYVYLDVLTQSGSWSLTFPDRSGTIATTDDIYTPQDTVLFDTSSGTIAIDANDNIPNKNFYGRLTRNTAVSSVAMVDGEKIAIGVLNIGTSYTLDWSATSVKWPGGNPPVQPIAGAGGTGFGLYIIWSIDGLKYGKLYTSNGPATRDAYVETPDHFTTVYPPGSYNPGYNAVDRVIPRQIP